MALATADRLIMLEHSIYSVISPEGCASILWKNAEKMREAAQALRLTAQDLAKLGVCDRVVEEPLGGAQRGREDTIDRVGEAIAESLAGLDDLSPAEIRAERRLKYMRVGDRGLS